MGRKASVKTKRKCRDCNTFLPATRYFKCLKCQPHLPLVDEDYIYEDSYGDIDEDFFESLAVQTYDEFHHELHKDAKKHKQEEQVITGEKLWKK